MNLTFYIFASIVAILLISVISARGRQIADAFLSLARAFGDPGRFLLKITTMLIDQINESADGIEGSIRLLNERNAECLEELQRLALAIKDLSAAIEDLKVGSKQRRAEIVESTDPTEDYAHGEEDVAE